MEIEKKLYFRKEQPLSILKRLKFYEDKILKKLSSKVIIIKIFKSFLLKEEANKN